MFATGWIEGRDLIAALGLPADSVKRVVLVIDAEDVIKAHVQYYVQQDVCEKVTEALRGVNVEVVNVPSDAVLGVTDEGEVYHVTPVS